MFAVSPIATASTALSVPPSVLAAPASDLVSTRVTAVAVAAPLSNSQVANEAPANPPAPVPAASAENTATQANTASGATGGNAPATGPSSTYLAQLISQSETSDSDGNEDNQIALESSFAGFAPAPRYTTFISYGIVKYRPSDAGLPTSYNSSVGASQAQSAPVTTATSDYHAYNTTQSRNQSNLVTEPPQLVVAG